MYPDTDEVVDVPTAVVTLTCVKPGVVVAGVVAVISESEITVKLVAGVDPKSTAVVPVNPEPEMTTEVLPTTEPDDGETEVRAGGEPVT